MEHSIITVKSLMSSNIRLEIPPYQREYQWGREQWEALWQDLGSMYLRKASGQPFKNHFFGILLLNPLPSVGISGANRFAVIDGQQRLTTLLLLLAAIRDHDLQIRGAELPENHGLYFIRNAENVVEGTRLTAQEKDQPSLDKVMRGQWRSWYQSCTKKKTLQEDPVMHCYTYFRLCLWRGEGSFDEDDLKVPLFRAAHLANGHTAEDLWNSLGLARPQEPPNEIELEKLQSVIHENLEVLQLGLQQSDEDAPTIFESINAKRTQLQQWDFIRNLIFTSFPEQEAHQLYENEWRAVQSEIQSTTYEGKRSDATDGFIYDYLIARGEHLRQGSISKNRGFEHLRNMIADRVPNPTGSDYRQRLHTFVVDDFLSAARSWPAAVGWNGRPVGRTDSLPADATTLITSIGKLSAGPAFPAVLHFVEGWAMERVSDGQLKESLGLLETYLARLVLAKRPLSPLRASFMSMMDRLYPSLNPDDLKEYLVGSPTDPGPMPDDTELWSRLLSEDYYRASVSGSQLGAIFRGIERQLAGTAANPLPYGSGGSDMSVEHIFPRSCVDAPHGAWGADLATWRVQVPTLAQHLHRLGNLTLVTNSANNYLKAKPFAKKKQVFESRDPDMPHPILSINQSVISATKWTHVEVEARTNFLAGKVIDRWPFPT